MPQQPDHAIGPNTATSHFRARAIIPIPIEKVFIGYGCELYQAGGIVTGQHRHYFAAQVVVSVASLVDELLALGTRVFQRL
jgi:hypothetical protein